MNFDNAQLSSLVSALPDPAIVVAENGEVVSANDPACLLLEVSPIGKHLTFSLRAPNVLHAVSDAIRDQTSTQVEHIIRAAVPRTIEVYVSPLGQQNGNDRIALIILRDLTYEQQLERMRADFVANASHELRTPLASISGFIETMQGAAKNDPKAQAKFLDVMKAQADRMSSLIDDLLSLSRIEINEHLTPLGEVNLVDVVKKAKDLLAPISKEQNCEVRMNMPDSLNVTGDEGQLSQVVINLIENALKYAASGKFIDIEGSEKNGSVHLTVKDHGPGIAPQHVPRLTERFYRVNVQDSRMRGGTGLGLAIAKHIINRHRGKLLIESIVGQGSQFSIHLPSL
jgi:two-component system, OmpR family, phosphate regulon sensor histidine kinase PhoR